MGTKSKALAGARCKLYINGALSGVFSDVSWGLNQNTQPVYILGSYGPAEIAYVDQEVVTVRVSGFRVVDNGPHAIGNVPKLQELLNHEDITLSIMDRQTDKTIMTLTGVRPTGYDQNTAARGLVTLSVTFLGLRMNDETGEHEEPGAATFG